MISKLKGNVEPIPVVRSVKDAGAWAQHQLGCISQHFGNDAVLDIHATMLHTEISTAFSGIGSAEVAYDAIGCCLEHYIEFDTKLPMRSLYAIDNQPEARHELGMLKHAPCCSFGDIIGFISPSVSELIKNNACRMPAEDLMRIF